MNNIFPGIKGKKVLVTGGTGGIGSTIVELFASSGAIVGVHYHQNEKIAQKICDSIIKKKGKALDQPEDT